MTTISHGFSADEFSARLARAQAAMDADGFDALVFTTPHNVRWATGFDTQFWESPTRPWFVVIPRDGVPVAIIPEIGAAPIAATWIGDIRTWPAPRPEDDGTSLLADTLDGVKRKYARVGFELGREQSLRMPVMQFFNLRDRLPGWELCDGAACIWSFRMIKSEAEIAKIRHICQIASGVYERVPDFVASGMTERDAARAMRIALADAGAESTPFLPAISGPGGVSQIICGPSDRELRDGDILFFDTGSTFDGYWCDFDRNYAVGNVDDAAHRAHDAMWRATDAGIAAARPGTTAEDLFNAMAAIIDEVSPTPSTAGRLGHGLGMQLTEPPSHMLGDKTVLEVGMVITIEPGVAYAPDKIIAHEENIVIREDGAELLTTRTPKTLPQLNA